MVIPTGLGKTIIALMLAVHRLTDQKDSKVIFLAPTKPLVNQHYQSFLELTSLPEETLQPITGSTSPEKRKELWDTLQIAFMTPQTLQNDLIAGDYDLKEVSLIIFDECHRAIGDYAYCFVAKKYMQDAISPQILGLTASPGSTEEKIREIKDNLFIDHIEIRTDTDGDVRPYVQNVDNQWIKIPLPPEFKEILKMLNEKLKACYKFLKEQELLHSYDLSKVSRKDVLKMNTEINNRIAAARDDNERFQLFYAKKLAANSIRLSHMSELLETQGINALQKYMEKNERKIQKNTANKSLKELFADKEFKQAKSLTFKLSSEGLVHPKLEKLEELLTQQLNQNKESRILVFCHFRDSVNNIVDYFEDSEAVRAHKFVGQANKGKDKGLTQKKQIEILKAFKEGIYNTLIGTSVAEEGLDIAECDLVIFYDVVPSAVRSIQRRGRTGRKKEGKVIILMAEGTRDEGYYWAEKAKEKNMKRSLRNMKKEVHNSDAGQSNLLDFVAKEEEKEKDEGENTEKYLRDIEQIKGADNYRILCDHRETASPVVRILSLMGLDLQLEQLAVADYQISSRVGIERKSAQDFNDSIKDGRLFDELFALKENFERAILILEGDPFLESHINENALYGALTSVILNVGITVYKTQDPRETARFLYQLAKKEQSQSKANFNIRYEKAPIEMSDLLEYLIAGVPGVNSLRAKNLLKHFKTLQEIFNSDIPDLTKVENIGVKIAQEIYKIARFQYKGED